MQVERSEIPMKIGILPPLLDKVENEKFSTFFVLKPAGYFSQKFSQL